MSARASSSLRERAAMRALALALLLAACGAPAPRSGEHADPRSGGVEQVVLSVSDLDVETAFFCDVLGFEREGTLDAESPELRALLGIDVDSVRGVRLRLGAERVALVAYGSGRPFPELSRSNDRWFQHLAIVVGDIDAAWARVASSGAVAISDGGPQTIPASNAAAGGIRAVYFRDPEGHPLELIWYPAGKGQARWQEGDGLFLGIDHTAIAASDSDRSIAFYRGLFGLAIAGESLNSGREQEALSAVPGARVRITGLRGASGPGVELLEYLEPTDGRPAPTDTRAGDRWSTETTVEGDVDRAIDRVASLGGTLVSDRAVRLGSRREVLLRDPDGHAVRVVER